METEELLTLLRKIGKMLENNSIDGVRLPPGKTKEVAIAVADIIVASIKKIEYTQTIRQIVKEEVAKQYN